MRKILINRLLALLLCALLFASASPAAFAEENDQRAAEPDLSVLDPAELQALTDQTLADLGVDGEKVSIGYCYTPTGETWYHREDDWYYSASLYKVPLMMILAQRQYEGELTEESSIAGLSLKDAEHYVLTLSHNDYAHAMMHYIGTDRECRELYRQFASLEEDYYVNNFYDYSYFTARFMTQVMMTLYYQQERFPNVIDCLLEAQDGEWFESTGSGEYEIAQKYGSLQEANKTLNNHTTGIIYTPEPFILTVMTRNVSDPQKVVSTVRQSFQDYTLQLSEKLAAARTERDEEQRRQQEAAVATETPSEVYTPQPAPSATIPPAPVETELVPAETAPTAEKRDLTPLFIGLVVLVLLAGVFVLTVLPRIRRGEAPFPGKKTTAGRDGGKRYTPRH